jgi:hypothetical protein
MMGAHDLDAYTFYGEDTGQRSGSAEVRDTPGFVLFDIGGIHCG